MDFLSGNNSFLLSDFIEFYRDVRYNEKIKSGVSRMIETIVSVQLPIKEELKIKKNRLTPDEMTGRERRICIVSGLYGDELGGQYICGEVIRRIKANYDMLKGIVDVYPTINSLGLDSRSSEIPMFDLD